LDLAHKAACRHRAPAQTIREVAGLHEKPKERASLQITIRNPFLPGAFEFYGPGYQARPLSASQPPRQDYRGYIAPTDGLVFRHDHINQDNFSLITPFSVAGLLSPLVGAQMEPHSLLPMVEIDMFVKITFGARARCGRQSAV
jgi:hypothetical protein